jgi:mRNA-degrading endonuclease RelE of RelBE toxin-antitoxin system
MIGPHENYYRDLKQYLKNWQNRVRKRKISVIKHTVTGISRTGNVRIVYRVNMDMIEVIVVAVGMRRELEVYSKAQRRTKGS